MRLGVAVLVLSALVTSLPIRAQETESAALHLRVAMKAVEDGNYPIALDEVNAAARLAPADAAIQFALATILEKVGKTEEALAALERAQSIGIPEAVKPKVDDLKATLLYKQRKSGRGGSG